MKTIINSLFTLLVAAAFAGCCNSNSREYSIEKAGEMPAFEAGYEKGVSACYAAATENSLFIAGGCNFPGIPAAEGGSKVYYKGIYRTETEDSFQWEKFAELPEESAYGVSLQTEGKWIIAGGTNSSGASDKVYIIDLTTLAIEELPSLPCTIDNAAGAANGSNIYITGGNANGTASARTFALDLDNTDKGWLELPPIPSGERVQPVCAATDEALYVWGGFAPLSCDAGPAVYTNGIRFDFASQTWSDAGRTYAGDETLTLSGGIAIAIDNNTILAAGGVDKDIFLDAISNTYNLVAKEEYMHKPHSWYRFNNRLMLYDTKSGKWSVETTDSCLSRAGAQITLQGENLYYIGGELKPGIRSCAIYRISKH